MARKGVFVKAVVEEVCPSETQDFRKFFDLTSFVPITSRLIEVRLLLTKPCRITFRPLQGIGVF